MSVDPIEFQIKAKALLGEAQKQISAFMKEIETQSAATGESTKSLTKTVEAQGAKITGITESVRGGFGSILTALGPIGAAITGAFSVGAVMNAASAVLDFAGNVSDLSAQTGIGVQRLQALTYAASGAGASVEQISGAVSQLGKRLIDGDAGAVHAVGRLGLSIQELTSASPDEAFLQISDAIKTIPSPMEQSQLAMELFGRAGIQLLPALKDDLRGLSEEAMRNGAVVSAELIAKADELGDRWGQLKIRGKALMADVLIPMLDIASHWKSADSDFSLLGRIDPNTDRQVAALKQQLAAPEFTNAPHTMKSLAEATHGVSLASFELSSIEKEINAKLAEQKKHAEELARAREQAFGLDKIAQARLMVEAIGGLSGVAKMSAEQVSQLHKTLDAALDAALRNGQEVPPSWMRIWSATETATTGLQAYLKTVGDVAKAYNTIPPPTALLPTLNSGIGEALAKATPGIQTQSETIGSMMGLHMSAGLGAGFRNGLQAVGSTLVGALQGGGDALKAVAGQMGLSISQEMFGSANFQKLITSHFGQALGGMFNAFLPGIGALAGPLIEKIGSLFKSLFGGPDKKELEGRGVWDSFVDSMRAAQTEADKLEIRQNVAKGATEQWATAAVVLKNKYIELGLSGDQALSMITQLQNATKQGGDAVRQVMDQINATLAQQKTTAADATTSVAADFNDLATGAVANLHAQVERPMGVTVDTSLASSALSQLSDQARRLQAMLADRGFNGGSGGEGTSEGRNESHILDGLSESEAREAWKAGIANTGSTDRDWDRVKDQYGFRGAAGGGIYERPALRVIAENRPEIVGEPTAIADALFNAMSRLGGMPGGRGGPIYLTVKLGEDVIDERIIDVAQAGLANGKLRVGRRNLVERV